MTQFSSSQPVAFELNLEQILPPARRETLAKACWTLVVGHTNAIAEIISDALLRRRFDVYVCCCDYTDAIPERTMVYLCHCAEAVLNLPAGAYVSRSNSHGVEHFVI